MKMKDNERMEDYIQRVNDLADQLASYSTEKVSNEDKAIVLTQGLPETYSTVVLTLQETGNIEDYEHVVNSLINKETQCIKKGQLDAGKNDEKAFYSNNRGNR